MESMRGNENLTQEKKVLHGREDALPFCQKKKKRGSKADTKIPGSWRISRAFSRFEERKRKETGGKESASGTGLEGRNLMCIRERWAS